jgi:hypothetical protein
MKRNLCPIFRDDANHDIPMLPATDHVIPPDLEFVILGAS